jgi:hypothetical protein
VISDRLTASGAALPAGAEELALVIAALLDGMMVQQLIEPTVPRDEPFGHALRWLFVGLLAEGRAAREGPW